MAAEVRACFDRVEPDLGRERLRPRVADGPIRGRIGQWLTAGGVEGETLRDRARGRPPGGVGSPRLAQVVRRDVLDAWWRSESRAGQWSPALGPAHASVSDSPMSGRNRGGASWVSKRTTAKNRRRRAMTAVGRWGRHHRHDPRRESCRRSRCRGTGCVHRARPDLWGAWSGNRRAYPAADAVTHAADAPAVRRSFAALTVGAISPLQSVIL